MFRVNLLPVHRRVYFPDSVALEMGPVGVEVGLGLGMGMGMGMGVFVALDISLSLFPFLPFPLPLQGPATEPPALCPRLRIGPGVSLQSSSPFLL